MAFVHEFIPDSERGFFEKYDLPIWHNGTWTLDRERNVYFIYIKTEIYDGIFSEYCLIFKGEKIRIQIERRAMCKIINGKEVRFTGIIIEKVTAPKKLKLYCDEIIDIITAAFSEEFRWTLRKDEPPIENRKMKILHMAQPTFGFRELYPVKIILLEIKQYTGDIMLFRFNRIPLLSENDIRGELAEAECLCKADPNADFAALMKEKRIWGGVDMSKCGDELPDWVYDRDTGKLYAPKG